MNMEKLNLLLIAFIFILCSSCKKKEQEPDPIKEIELVKGKIIGFDQCRRFDSFVLVINKDTLVTYNDLDSLYGAFPDYYYELYNWEFMFPEEERDKYPVYINYSMVEEKDKVGVICNAFGSFSNYTKAVKNRQIKVNYITKFPKTKIQIINQ